VRSHANHTGEAAPAANSLSYNLPWRLMAQKPKKRSRRFNLRRVRFSVPQAMATTGNKVAVVGNLTGAADGAYRVKSVKAAFSSLNLAATDGPLIVGYAHSDYTVTEIKECIEASSAISVGDKIAQEKANRLVRIVGVLEEAANDDLNDGRPISTKLNWLIPIGKIVNMFIYNDGIAMTTGCVVSCNGEMWIQDSQ